MPTSLYTVSAQNPIDILKIDIVIYKIVYDLFAKYKTGS